MGRPIGLRWWQQFTANVSAGVGVAAPLSPELRAGIVLVAAVAGLVASVVPATYVTVTGNLAQLDVPMSLAGLGLTLVVLWALLLQKSVDLAAWLMLGVGGLMTAYSATRNGGIMSPDIIWLVLHPLVAVLFLGSRVGIAFAVVDELIVLGFGFFAPDANPAGQAMRITTFATAIPFAAVLGVAYEGSIRRGAEARRRLEERVQRARTLETLGILAGGLAHDFNNIFQVILGNAELLRDAEPSDAKRQRQVERICKASRQGAEHVAHMLAYATGGQTTLDDVNLTELVSEQADLLRSPLGPASKLALELEPKMPPVEADGAQLRRVLTNLVSNASESLAADGGHITVRTGTAEVSLAYLAGLHLGEDLRPGAYGFLEVDDDGRGIDAATISRMFDPFFSTKQTGRGLGLAAVIGIVRAHGGAIDVVSGLGRGTRMRVLFPLCAKADGSRNHAE